jgi:hypothetical protein
MMIALSTTTPDGDGDAAQAHDVGVDPQQVHRQQADEHAAGNDEDGDQRAAAVQEKEDADQRDDEHFLDQRVPQRVDGALDQFRAVVGGLDRDAGRQAVFQFGQFALASCDDLIGIGAEAGDDDAADRFALAVPFADAAALFAGDLQRGDIAQQDRRTAPFRRREERSPGRQIPFRYPRLRTMYSFSLISTTEPPTSLLERWIAVMMAPIPRL